MDEDAVVQHSALVLPVPNLQNLSKNKPPNPGETNKKPLDKEADVTVKSVQPVQTDNQLIYNELPICGNTKPPDVEGAASRSEEEDGEGKIISLENEKTYKTFVPLDKFKREKTLEKVHSYLETKNSGTKVFNFSENPKWTQYRKDHEYKIVEILKPKSKQKDLKPKSKQKDDVLVDVVVIEETKTKARYVLKRVDKNWFCRNKEADAMHAFVETGSVPYLLMIVIDNDKDIVDLIMDYIYPCLTLKEYTDKYPESSDIKFAFCLYAYIVSLQFIDEMYKREWQHGDLHHENIIIVLKESTIILKFLDFGEAEKEGRKISGKDFMLVFRNFRGMFVGNCSASDQDIEKGGKICEEICREKNEILNKAQVGGNDRYIGYEDFINF